MDFFDIMSLIGAVVVIIGALVLTYYASRWYAKRMAAGSSGGGKYVKIIDRAPLAQGNAVYIIKTAGRYYMLGVADKKVNLLTELPGFEETPEGNEPLVASFSQVMRGVLKSRGGDTK